MDIFLEINLRSTAKPDCLLSLSGTLTYADEGANADKKEEVTDEQ